MDLAMTLPTMLPHGRDEILAWCREVDEGPWSSLAVPERITYTSHAWLVQLSAAAALTERVRLWTTIVILPAHDAVQTAKDLASVDRLSDGRLTVGLGVGGREHDYRAVGASTARRWARMDEQVETMRRIWAGEPPFEGADPVGPPPVQAGGPPLVAGVMGPKALARAAHWAVGVDDGSTVMGVTPEGVAGVVERIRGAWAAAGRTDAPHISASLWYALGDGAEDRLRGYAYDYMRIFGEDLAKGVASMMATHTPEAVRAAVDAMAAAGCDECFLVPTTVDPVELDRTREALGI
jgi:alkanesulfonate monooxygenase SsuD/methylene tetrahydromethanopterin reductase-like flavin-dependent oxidoreductase (luciferase family)